MKFIITYTNSKGKVLTTTRYSAESAGKFMEYLDERIQRGTCTGYIATLKDYKEVQ